MVSTLRYLLNGVVGFDETADDGEGGCVSSELTSRPAAVHGLFPSYSMLGELTDQGRKTTLELGHSLRRLYVDESVSVVRR